jgi:hypothetical protein
MYQVHTMNCLDVFMVELMVSTNSNELHLYNVMRLDDGRGQSVLYGILCLARLSGTRCPMLFFLGLGQTFGMLTFVWYLV